MAKLLTICLVVVGLINFLPVVGMLSAKKLETAYAIAIQSSELEILMRHRALLFGVLGGFILYAAFSPSYQGAAMIMAAVSMIGYAVLTLLVGDYNPALFKVLVADVVGIGFLLAAAFLKYGMKVG